MERHLLINLPTGLTCLSLAFAQVTKVTTDRGNRNSSFLSLSLMFCFVGFFFLSRHASMSKPNSSPVDTAKKGFLPRTYSGGNRNILCSWQQVRHALTKKAHPGTAAGSRGSTLRNLKNNVNRLP